MMDHMDGYLAVNFTILSSTTVTDSLTKIVYNRSTSNHEAVMSFHRYNL